MHAESRNAERELTRLSVGVLGFCLLMNVISRGMAETFAVFLLPVTGDLGWSRSEFGLVYSVFMLVFGASAPLVGVAFDRYGPKFVYLSGLILYGSGMLTAAQMGSLWEAMLGIGLLMGMGVAATGMLAAAGLISRWFSRRITFANAFAYIGLPVGLFLIIPATQILITETDWRTAYRVLGTIILCTVPLIWFLPWKRIAAGAPGKRQSTLKRSRAFDVRILKHPAFWGLLATFFLPAVTVWLVMLQAIAYLVAAGFDPLTAATAHGAVGAASIVGILGTGWLCDKYGQRNIATISYVMTILGVVIFSQLLSNPTTFGLYAFILTFGVVMGSRGPAVAALVAKLYPHNVAGVYGATTIGLGLGGALGGWLSGLLYDLTGGYDASFAIAVGASVIGIAVFWLIRPLSKGHWPDARSDIA